MSDPYKVLGVSKNVSDEALKAAYHDLVRKYHPDTYAGNPLSDLASEKMKDINVAYDQITAQRKSGTAGSENSYNNYSSYSQPDSQFADIRSLINRGRITEAEELLDGVPVASKDAEWHFLKGMIQHSRGWMDEAFENISKACSMNPQNQEYQAAKNQLLWQRQTANPFGTNTNSMYSSCNVCNICTTLYCADFFCKCLGCC